MGCDIHMWMETRRDGVWSIVKTVPCGRCYGTGLQGNQTCWSCKGDTVDILEQVKENYGSDAEPDHHDVWRGGRIYHNRNYALFGVLAGVRSRCYGDPLYPPRGIPSDASPEYRDMAEGLDWHSHHWLSYLELVEVCTVQQCLDLDDSHAPGWMPLKEFVTYVVIGLLEPIAKELGDDNVRVVFYFDN